MSISGNLRKMPTALKEVVEYYLPLSNELIFLNNYLEKTIQLSFTGQINCIVCGRKTKKSFGQGSCYPCFKNAPENAPCIINPELCEAHLGKGRNLEWEQKHHVQPHVVYLALSSGLKVGVTRATQVPYRWIDQGANEAIILAETPYRQLAGEIEVALKAYYNDKTNWRKMLTNQVAEANLKEMKAEAVNFLPWKLEEFVSDNDKIYKIPYPVNAFPEKVTSLSFDKTPVIEETLVGIKGQYLIFEGGKVLNIRKHNGYFIEFNA